MTDAVHDQHWRLARDHDRTVATGPAVSSPRVPNFFAEVMFIQKNRLRTIVAESIGETLAELPFTGDQAVCLGHDQAAWSGPERQQGPPPCRHGTHTPVETGRRAGPAAEMLSVSVEREAG